MPEFKNIPGVEEAWKAIFDIVDLESELPLLDAVEGPDGRPVPNPDQIKAQNQFRRDPRYRAALSKFETWLAKNDKLVSPPAGTRSYQQLVETGTLTSRDVAQLLFTEMVDDPTLRDSRGQFIFDFPTSRFQQSTQPPPSLPIPGDRGRLPFGVNRRPDGNNMFGTLPWELGGRTGRPTGNPNVPQPPPYNPKPTPPTYTHTSEGGSVIPLLGELPEVGLQPPPYNPPTQARSSLSPPPYISPATRNAEELARSVARQVLRGEARRNFHPGDLSLPEWLRRGDVYYHGTWRSPRMPYSHLMPDWEFGRRDSQFRPPFTAPFDTLSELRSFIRGNIIELDNLAADLFPDNQFGQTIYSDILPPRAVDNIWDISPDQLKLLQAHPETNNLIRRIFDGRSEYGPLTYPVPPGDPAYVPPLETWGRHGLHFGSMRSAANRLVHTAPENSPYFDVFPRRIIRPAMTSSPDPLFGRSAFERPGGRRLGLFSDVTANRAEMDFFKALALSDLGIEYDEREQMSEMSRRMRTELSEAVQYLLGNRPIAYENVVEGQGSRKPSVIVPYFPPDENWLNKLSELKQQGDPGDVTPVGYQELANERRASTPTRSWIDDFLASPNRTDEQKLLVQEWLRRSGDLSLASHVDLFPPGQDLHQIQWSRLMPNQEAKLIEEQVGERSWRNHNVGSRHLRAGSKGSRRPSLPDGVERSDLWWNRLKPSWTLEGTAPAPPDLVKQLLSSSVDSERPGPTASRPISEGGRGSGMVPGLDNVFETLPWELGGRTGRPPGNSKSMVSEMAAVRDTMVPPSSTGSVMPPTNRPVNPFWFNNPPTPPPGVDARQFLNDWLTSQRATATQRAKFWSRSGPGARFVRPAALDAAPPISPGQASDELARQAMVQYLDDIDATPAERARYMGRQGPGGRTRMMVGELENLNRGLGELGAGGGFDMGPTRSAPPSLAGRPSEMPQYRAPGANPFDPPAPRPTPDVYGPPRPPADPFADMPPSGPSPSRPMPPGVADPFTPTPPPYRPPTLTPPPYRPPTPTPPPYTPPGGRGWPTWTSPTGPGSPPPTPPGTVPAPDSGSTPKRFGWTYFPNAKPVPRYAANLGIGLGASLVGSTGGQMLDDSELLGGQGSFANDAAAKALKWGGFGAGFGPKGMAIGALVGLGHEGLERLGILGDGSDTQQSPTMVDDVYQQGLAAGIPQSEMDLLLRQYNDLSRFADSAADPEAARAQLADTFRESVMGKYQELTTPGDGTSPEEQQALAFAIQSRIGDEIRPYADEMMRSADVTANSFEELARINPELAPYANQSAALQRFRASRDATQYLTAQYLAPMYSSMQRQADYFNSQTAQAQQQMAAQAMSGMSPMASGGLDALLSQYRAG